MSLYSAVWGLTLVLFEYRLINYYPLEIETLIVIFSTWLLFVFGSFTGVFITTKNQETNKTIDDILFVRVIHKALWIINGISLFGAFHTLYVVSNLFGGIANAFILGNLLYSYRVAEGLPGSIPYIASWVFVGSVLAGTYTSVIGKITLHSIIPLISIIIIDFANMGRADILVVMLLFMSAYFLTSHFFKKNSARSDSKLKKYIMFVIVVSLVIVGAEIIRGSRNVNEGFKGSSSTLKKFNNSTIITPSVYLYLSSHYGILNQYLIKNKEDTTIGGHTFLPIFRILDRMGLDFGVKTYQEWYKTPVQTNTGTYLRELHGDFGLIGLLIGPYIMGFLASVYWYKLQLYRRYKDMFIITFLYTVIGLSFFVMITRMGGFFFFIFLGIFVGVLIDKKLNVKR